MVKTRFGLLDTIESIPLETKKRLKKKYDNDNDDEQEGNDKKYVETTYSELKSLRDEGKLVPGALYRITDYQCTTTQEDTRSAGYQFDIIVQALSENILSEDAKAVQHEVSINDIPKYCMNDLYNDIATLFGTVTVNDVIYYSYRNSNYEFLIDINNLIEAGIDSNNNYPGYPYFTSANLERRLDTKEYTDAQDVLFFSTDIRKFSYFSNSNLAAWKLKYCLDNDENRFAWAKNLYLSPVTHNKCIRLTTGNQDNLIFVRQPQLDDTNGIAWALDDDVEQETIKQYSTRSYENLINDETIFTSSEDVFIGQKVQYGDITLTIIDFSEEGKGVIYRMIDEHNNDCPYDFKNIQFLRDVEWYSQHHDWANEVIGQNPNKNIYYFTFSWINSDFSVEDVSVVGKNDDTDVLMHAENNIINVYVDEIYNCRQLFLNNIILVSSYHTDSGVYYGTINNVFRYGCRNCTFGDRISDNIFDTAFIDNIISNDFSRNKSFGEINSLNGFGSINKKIIYTDSNYTVYFKDINDAFSGT